MDAAAAEEPIIIPSKDNKLEKEQLVKKKRKLLIPSTSGNGDYDSQVEIDKSDQSHVPSSDSANQSRPESPSDYLIDYNTLVPSIALDCSSDSDSKKENSIEPTHPKQVSRPETVKEAVEQSKNMKLKSDTNNDMVTMHRLGSNAALSIRQVFPNEDSLPLQGEVNIGSDTEYSADGWLKCTTTIQYDKNTKKLWNRLQQPYGNQSSFLKHLLLLENYFRKGELVLTPNASHYCVAYNNAVHNRLRAFDNIPENTSESFPKSISPPTKSQKNIYAAAATTGTTSNCNKQSQSKLLPVMNAAKLPKNTPIKISQLKSASLQSLPAAVPVQKTKTVSAPPDLISLQPGTKKPVLLVKSTKSQKFKFPIPRDWRPNLIPSETYTPKHAVQELGFVQVVSAGKSYYITREDYSKMCAIKKSFELRQLRLSQQEGSKISSKTINSVLKTGSSPRQGFLISKTSTSSKNNELATESLLEKLDKHTEKSETNKSLSLPKIPKSLTVIPQTVARKPSRPSSPVLMITSKPKQAKKS